jgi:two-component system, OmpR family, response regulator ResD
MSRGNPRVLVVDDDPMVSEVVVSYLRRAGFEAEQTSDGAHAVALAHANRPDLVVLDLMLPGLDGLEVCRQLRELGEVPVIMLTALGAEHDRVLGFEVGADDYVTKPFSPRELVLRVQSVLRRTGRGQGTDPAAAGTAAAQPAAAQPAAGTAAGTAGSRLHRSGSIELDVVAHRATKAGRPLALTGREFDLLAFFLAHPGQAFSRTELMERVWGWSFGDPSTVTVHIRRLREKIEPDPASPTSLVTVWGVGYRFDGEG